MVAHQVGEAAALDEVHGEIELSLMLADLVDGDNVRVLEVSGGTGLGVKALQVLLAGELPRKDHLEGDHAIKADLARSENNAHPAAGDFIQQFIIAKVSQGSTDRWDRCRLRG